MVYKFFNKKAWSGISVNKQPAQELHKPVIKRLKRKKIYAKFKDNIWAADLAELGSMSSKNTNVKYLLCVLIMYRCFH